MTAISPVDNTWSVAYEDGSGTQEARGDGLVITGAGEPHRFPRSGASEGQRRVFNGQNIWHAMDVFKDMKHARIAVIGAGETAAGIVTRPASQY